ncbi:hypothetical protein D8674_014339 [Pyrus ussuriensis x Pyrus communis]|uniref:Vesicle-fusing ATPase n=1 Tax=Pyrus ussuriensis x Pyrus communis TaxID=2448454 RepID=A0A5N5GZG2_9ROSA|nr:hypothetical protein D8674_014339 [Pyrus ussuriensis x Pyrus communis]
MTYGYKIEDTIIYFVASGNEALEGETEKLLKKEEILKFKKEELQTKGQEQDKLQMELKKLQDFKLVELVKSEIGSKILRKHHRLHYSSDQCHKGLAVELYDKLGAANQLLTQLYIVGYLRTYHCRDHQYLYCYLACGRAGLSTGMAISIVDDVGVSFEQVGETKKNVRNLFADAENDQRARDQSGLHAIIFDEMDAICKKKLWDSQFKREENMV